MRRLIWLAFFATFGLLVLLRTGSSESAPIPSSGIEVTTHLDPKQPVTFNGIVLRRKTNAHGSRTLTVETADLNQITVVVPPTLYVRTPGIGDTVKVTARPFAPGALTVESSKDLKVTIPSAHRNNKRFVQEAVVVPGYQTRSGGCVATLFGDRNQLLGEAILTKEAYADWRPHSLQTLYGYKTGSGDTIVEDLK